MLTEPEPPAALVKSSVPPALEVVASLACACAISRLARPVPAWLRTVSVPLVTPARNSRCRFPCGRRTGSVLALIVLFVFERQLAAPPGAGGGKPTRTCRR
jgi:hypothetical protein